MSFTQELTSWMSPPRLETGPQPEIGQKAPNSEKLRVPTSDGRPQIITFLRHCGCPFAEKTFKLLRETAAKHPDIQCIAVSHSNSESTLNWVNDVGGDNFKSDDPNKPPSEPVRILVDAERELYGQWGLGSSSWAHVLHPGGLYSVFKLGREEGIWNRPTSSGYRWQTAGSFAVDKDGTLLWGGPSSRSDDIPDFEEAVRAITK